MNEELKIRITAEVSKLKKAVSDAKGEIKSLASEAKKEGSEVQKAFQDMGQSISNGLKIGAVAAVGLGAALLSTVEASEETRKSQAMIATAFEAAGGSAETAGKVYNDFYRILGDTGQATEATQLASKLTTGKKELSEWTKIATGVYAVFGESIPIESLMEAANETAKTGEVTGVLADALNWAGVSEEEFQAKLSACNTEAEREILLRETLGGLYDESAELYEKNAADLLAYNEAQLALQNSLAAVGEALTPVKTALMELGSQVLADLAPYIQDFAENHLPTIKEKLDGVGEAIGKVMKFIADNWGIIGPMAATIIAIAGALALVNTALGIYNTVMAVTAIVSAPVIGIFAAIVVGIGLLVAAIVACVKHWDEIKEAVRNACETINNAASNMVDKVVQFVKDLVKFVSDDFKQMGENMKQKVDDAKQKVSTGFENIKTAISDKVEAAKSAVSNKFDAMKSGISQKVDAIKSDVSSRFDNIKSKIESTIEGAKSSAINKFNSIKTGISNAINGARDAVQSAIDRIKSIMNFSWSLPKLKLPRISVSGKFSINPPSAPKFSISWYKFGGVFDNPTLFGYGNGMLGGLGEDGAEAVVPLEKNTKWLDIIAQKLSANMGGNTPIVLQVDGKTFAEIACANINQLTRQRGAIPLNMY